MLPSKIRQYNGKESESDWKPTSQAEIVADFSVAFLGRLVLPRTRQRRKTRTHLKGVSLTHSHNLKLDRQRTDLRLRHVSTIKANQLGSYVNQRAKIVCHSQWPGGKERDWTRSRCQEDHGAEHGHEATSE